MAILILKNSSEIGLVNKITALRECILMKHPKFWDLFNSEDPFRIKYDTTFRELIKRYSDFSFEKYEVDIQGEAYEEVKKDVMVGACWD